MDNNIEKLPGVIVEDITHIVEFYMANLPVNPVTNQSYAYEDITRIMCQYPDVYWNNCGLQYYHIMEIYLLKDIISDLRLDAIQHTNSIKEIATICRDAGL